jgi:hypothetical protein
MNDLETRYRRALRWYPKSWRAANEDAMVGTLLDVAEDDHRKHPARGEIGKLRTTAVALRLGPLGRIPASVRDRATALAFGLGSATAITALVALATQSTTISPYFLRFLPAVGPFLGYSFLFYATWILAFVAALLGWKWVARGLALAAVLVAVVLRFVGGGQAFSAPTGTTIILLGALALLGLVGNPFSTRKGRLWLAISTIGWTAFLGATIWHQRATHGGVAGRTDWFIGPLWQWLYWIVPFALILALVLMRVARSGWGGAMLMLLVPIVPFVVFGWAPRINDLIDRASLLAIAIAIVCAVYFIPRALGIRIRITRT